MEIYRRLSVMWTVDGNIQDPECVVESGSIYSGGFL